MDYTTCCICGNTITKSARYPNLICMNHINETIDQDGNPVQYENEDFCIDNVLQFITTGKKMRITGDIINSPQKIYPTSSPPPQTPTYNLPITS